jgi:hypothetical protein
MRALHGETTIFCWWLTICCVALTTAGAALACSGWNPEANFSYAYSPPVDEDIVRGGTLWGHRHVSCSQGYVCVEVWAGPVGNGIAGYFEHEETAYGNSTLHCTIHFHEPGAYSPKPTGMNLAAWVYSTGTYYLLDQDGGNSDFDLWVVHYAHSIDATYAPVPVHLAVPPEAPRDLGGSHSLSATDASWHQREAGVAFEVARISATAHAYNGIGGDSWIYSRGTNTATSWGFTWGNPYY